MRTVLVAVPKLEILVGTRSWKIVYATIVEDMETHSGPNIKKRELDYTPYYSMKEADPGFRSSHF